MSNVNKAIVKLATQYGKSSATVRERGTEILVALYRDKAEGNDITATVKAILPAMLGNGSGDVLIDRFCNVMSKWLGVRECKDNGVKVVKLDGFGESDHKRDSHTAFLNWYAKTETAKKKDPIKAIKQCESILAAVANRGAATEQDAEFAKELAVLVAKYGVTA